MVEVKYLDEFEKYSEHFMFRNNYDIKLNIPNISSTDLPQISNFTKTLRLFARSTSIPSISTTIKTQRIANKKRATPVQIDYDSIIITFFDTKTLSFRTFFDKWSKSRYDNNGHIKYYPDDFSTDMTIDLDNKRVYTIIGMFPTQVGDVRLDDNSVNEFGSFDVTFFVSDIVSESGNLVAV